MRMLRDHCRSSTSTPSTKYPPSSNRYFILPFGVPLFLKLFKPPHTLILVCKISNKWSECTDYFNGRLSLPLSFAQWHQEAKVSKDFGGRVAENLGKGTAKYFSSENNTMNEKISQLRVLILLILCNSDTGWSAVPAPQRSGPPQPAAGITSSSCRDVASTSNWSTSDAPGKSQPTRREDS